jgi:hypothetical protein
MKHYTFSILMWIILSTICDDTSIAETAIPPDHLALPVLITLDGDGSASGFFLNSPNYVYLVTASHVLFDGSPPRLKSHGATLLCWTKDPVTPDKVILKLDLSQLASDGLILRSKCGDAAVVRFGTRGSRNGGDGIVTHTNHVRWLEQSSAQVQGANAGNTKGFDDVFVSNDVYLFGYPSSIGIQEMPQLDYQRPLLRKGIIAGKNPSRRTIILDCPSYYGNSGGPVVQAERLGLGKTEFKIIGIVSQFVPFKETWVNVTHKMSHWEISNSGYTVVMPIDLVLDLIREHEAAEQPPERDK